MPTKTRSSAKKVAAKQKGKPRGDVAVGGGRSRIVRTTINAASLSGAETSVDSSPSRSVASSVASDSEGVGNRIVNVVSAKEVVLQLKDGRLTAKGILEAAKNFEMSPDDADQEYKASEKTDNQRIEAECFANQQSKPGSDLWYILRLLHLRDQASSLGLSGNRPLLQTKEEQDKELSYINKNIDLLVHRCPKALKTADIYVAMQWLKQALKNRSLDYLIGVVAVRMNYSKGDINVKTFAGINLEAANMVKTDRESELYRGDLVIASTLVLAVFAHEKANPENRAKLLSYAQDPEQVLEWIVTTYNYAWEPNADMEAMLIRQAEQAVDRMWESREPNTGNFTIEGLRAYFERIMVVLRVIHSSRWEQRVMEAVRRQIMLVAVRTSDPDWGRYHLLVTKLEQDHSHLDLTHTRGPLCFALAFRRALDVIIEEVRGAQAFIDNNKRPMDASSEDSYNGESARVVKRARVPKKHRFAKDACYSCGRHGHLGRECTFKEAVDGKPCRPQWNSATPRPAEPSNAETAQDSSNAPAKVQSLAEARKKFMERAEGLEVDPDYLDAAGDAYMAEARDLIAENTALKARLAQLDPGAGGQRAADAAAPRDGARGSRGGDHARGRRGGTDKDKDRAELNRLWHQSFALS